MWRRLNCQLNALRWDRLHSTSNAKFTPASAFAAISSSEFNYAYLAAKIPPKQSRKSFVEAKSRLAVSQEWVNLSIKLNKDVFVFSGQLFEFREKAKLASKGNGTKRGRSWWQNLNSALLMYIRHSRFLKLFDNITAAMQWAYLWKPMNWSWIVEMR